MVSLIAATYSNLLLEFVILFLKNKQLLMQVVSSTTSLHIENVFEMLNLLLELHDKSIFLCAHLVGRDFGQNLFSPICKL
jgi:hypothetical protein